MLDKPAYIIVIGLCSLDRLVKCSITLKRHRCNAFQDRGLSLSGEDRVTSARRCASIDDNSDVPTARHRNR